MTKLIQNIFCGSIASFIMVFSSCEKTVQIDPPLNEITTSVVFSSNQLATNAMAGVYTSLSTATSQNTLLPVYSSLQADDLLYNGVNSTYQEVFDNAYSSVSSIQSTIFSEWYAIIYRANSVIDGLQQYSGTTDLVKRQLTAEAKVIRAYCYFNLVNAFGGVPLVLTTDVGVSALLPKETAANVYVQIVKDLTEAKAVLPVDYSASSNTRLGVNKFVAAALLAKTSLFTGDFNAAESNASEVIASSLYTLIPSANIATGVWTKNNAESIWQMSSPLAVTNQYTVEAGTFLPFTGTDPQFEIRPAFLSLFSATDLRRQRWMTNYNVAGAVKVLPYKYKYTTNALAVAAGVAESQTVLRLSEQYLIRAEARTRMGTNLSGALSDLNTIRARAQTALSNTTQQAALLGEIILESRKEFFCEQGHRWYNLKRTGQADAVIGALKPSYRPNAKLLPFPNSALDANPNLIQNLGY